MPRVLKDLTITEVSSVDIGAGRGVKVLLMKRDGANPGDTQMTKEELDAAIAKAAADAAKTATADATKLFTAELAKRDDQIAVLKMSPAHKAFYDGLKDDDAKKAFSAMDDKGKDAECAKAVHKADTATLEDLAKRDEVVATVMKQNETLQKRLDAMDLKEQQTVFVKRAADLGLTAEGDGELMRKAYSGDATAQVAFEKRQSEIVKGLTKQVETGVLFKNFGTQHGATGADGYGQLMAKAHELQQTAAGKDLTEAQAFTKVYENPANRETVELYKRESAAAN